MFIRRKLDVNVPKFISAIKSNECLWNVENKYFNRRSSQTAILAWVDVANKIGKKGVATSDLRSKWKNLRDTYRKELKKNFFDGEYQGQWQYFQEFDFLRNSIISTEREKPKDPGTDEDNKEEQEVQHDGMVYKRKPNPLIVKLISEVRQHECLWNKDYFPVSKPSTRKSTQAWQEIAQKLGKPLNDIRRKWKNLRYCYRKEIMKNYSDGEYRGIWQYFNMLSFLKIDLVEISDHEESEEEEMPSPNVFEDSLPSDNNEEATQVKVEMEAIDNTLVYSHEESQEEPLPKRPKCDDEYDVMFLKSLVPFFRGMDPVRKLVLRSKIQDMVMKELLSTT